MRWKNLRRSENVEDQRGGGGGIAVGGGLMMLVIVVLALIFGVDPTPLLQQQEGGGSVQQAPAELSAEDREMGEFVKAILGSTEDVWAEEFARMGKQYEPARLRLFTNAVQSGCGGASAQMGPFYCPADRTVYVDLSFFRELHERFGAPGDFAQAYVIAHEVGHHVQNLLGISDQVHAAQQRAGKVGANELSVRLELQADFLAGMWARKGQQKFDFLESGDLEEALRAANKIGDDTLQRQAQGRVVPDSFTHGSSEQRMRWFKMGLQSDGFDPNNTFQTDDL